MARDNENTLKDEEAFTKEWINFNKINKSNNSAETTVEVHDSPEKVRPPAYTENWTPIPSCTNINGLQKRTDSKDSGWSFPTSEKQQDMSEESEIDNKDGKLDTSASDIKFDAVELTGMHSSDKKVNDIDPDRTSREFETTLDINEESALCDTHGYGDDGQGDGEFTPLVAINSTNSKRAGNADSNV